MNIIDYITKEQLQLVPVLYVIGSIIKNTPQIKNWVIPYIILFLGMIFGAMNSKSLFEGIIQGILVAGTTVMTNQLIKQTSNKNQ